MNGLGVCFGIVFLWLFKGAGRCAQDLPGAEITKVAPLKCSFRGLLTTNQQLADTADRNLETGDRNLEIGMTTDQNLETGKTTILTDHKASPHSLAPPRGPADFRASPRHGDKWDPGRDVVGQGSVGGSTRAVQ